MMKWLFFDLGSTLVDETECIEYRIRHLLCQPDAPSREVLMKKMTELASGGGNAYKCAAEYFGLQTAAWPSQLEKLYPDTVKVLSSLQKKYHLGLIANQNPGLDARLEAFRIRHFFEIIAASGDLGIAKPDPEIFRYALNCANCRPEEAMMIGDRLDNDIAPAANLGMRTLWIKRDTFFTSYSSSTVVKPDYTAVSLIEVLEMLL